MLREIILRDNSDPKYDKKYVETSDSLEALIYKIKMILLTNRGEILGDQEFGLNLEDHLFENKINERLIREQFYAQVAKYIPERNYTIDLEFGHTSDGVRNFLTIYVLLNGNRTFGLAV